MIYQHIQVRRPRFGAMLQLLKVLKGNGCEHGQI
jgi:hypothetical protein